MRLEKELTWKDIYTNKELTEKVGTILRDWAIITRNKEQQAAIKAAKRFSLPSRYSDYDRSFHRLCELTASLPLFLIHDGGGKWLLGLYAGHDGEELSRVFENIKALEKKEPLFADIILKLDDFSRFCKKILSGEHNIKEAQDDEQRICEKQGD